MSSPNSRIQPDDLAHRTVGQIATRFSLPLQGPSQTEIWSVVVSDQTAVDGALFCAVPGAKAHGARFAASAVARGARAVLTDAQGAAMCAPLGVPILVADDVRATMGHVAAYVYAEPATHLTTFAVTGTNGKTTTTYLLDGALRALGWRTGLIGTVETRSGERVMASRLTTPEAADLQALLAAMHEDHVEMLTMEVSSHALALHRVDGIVFDVAGFTNLSQDHLDLHGDMETYFAVKSDLFTAQRARRGVVVIEDTWGQRLAEQATIPIATVALSRHSGPADWTVTRTRADAEGTWVTLEHTDGRRVEAVCALPGAFNVANLALALAMVLEAGVDPRDVEESLGKVRPAVVPGRMEAVNVPGPGPHVVVDFAHNTEGLALALDALRERLAPHTPGHEPNRLHVVMGATGERDRGKRRAMGRVAVEKADVVVITDDDPHDEDPAAIRAELLAGAHSAIDAPARWIREIVPRDRAIHAAIAAARAGDIVVVAGRGHETIQEVAGRDVPLDDRVEARSALSTWVDPDGSYAGSAGTKESDR